RPYLKRANLYATRDCQCVYVLARGPRRATIAANVAKKLAETGGYSPLTTTTIISKHQGPDNYLITCIALRPDITTIVYNAWQRLEQDFQKGATVNSVIEFVT